MYIFILHYNIIVYYLCCLDISEGRLAVAKKMGADYTIIVTDKEAQEMGNVIATTMGANPDVTIECSGAASSVQTGIYVSNVSKKTRNVNLHPGNQS